MSQMGSTLFLQNGSNDGRRSPGVLQHRGADAWGRTGYYMWVVYTNNKSLSREEKCFEFYAQKTGNFLHSQDQRLTWGGSPAHPGGERHGGGRQCYRIRGVGSWRGRQLVVAGRVNWDLGGVRLEEAGTGGGVTNGLLCEKGPRLGGELWGLTLTAVAERIEIT